MLIPFASQHSCCDQIRRRSFLKIGALPGIGMGLPDFLRHQASGNISSNAPAKSAILLHMGGGASQIDSFDPKPLAPAEFRGPFNTISTDLPGIQVTEYLPQMSQQLKNMALIRSVQHVQSEHQQAAHYMLTGWMPSRVVFKNEHPSLGSVVVEEIGDQRDLPPYVVIRDPATFVNRHHGAAFLKTRCEPLQLKVPFKATDIAPPPNMATMASGLDLARVEKRRKLVTTYEQILRKRETWAKQGMDQQDHYFDKAFNIVTSSQAVSAFDLNREPDRVRDRYGRTLLGQACLMARRLVDAGVLFVTISRGGWDTHKNNFSLLKNELLPDLDQAMSALLEDLDQRGLLDSTLVIWSGEFGRTPNVNKDIGRDHWPSVMTMGLAGGGIHGGQVIGQTDQRSAFPTDRLLTPEDIWATLYHQLGIDWSRRYEVPRSFEFNSVPATVPILPYGTPIRELFS